jgi:hypothetical protein
MTRPHPSGPDDFDPAHPDHWPAPPEPTPEVWEKTRTDIVARLPRRPAGQRWLVPAAATGGLIAAGVLVAWGVWSLVGGVAPPAEPTTAVVAEKPTDPLAEFDVLPIATASDVMVSAVRGGEVRFGSINHPVPETMPLASAADVTVHRGPTAGELSCPDPNGMAVYVMPDK